MVKFGLVLAAGYTGFRLAYNSEDGIHYGKVGEQTLRTGLALFFAALAGGLTYAALVLH
ncbi:hypothetical protein FB561_5552 [Kribbella amoyensis]|uniref:Uncharacterized protein n=1 Tax=Kribbella amoyensis TaxID=996641 RepID=A0A561BZM5_9ACTN|nr:hypothetical protein [Kribbella amoyensis]TWD84365.1 hypothetical protein FB561_5552 [Kribbella amoyensis]